MSVRVRREKPDQRRHHRVTAPLFMRIGDDGPVVRARDWSLGGLRIDDYPAALPEIGVELEMAITLPFQGFDISFTAKGRVVRVIPDIKSFGFEFTEIGEREQALMHHFIEDLVRGSMSEVADSIQRIDVPVTPVSTDPDPDLSKSVVAEKKIPLRQIVWVATYAMIGFLVFGYMGLVLYSNVFRMEVQTAVVSSPIVEVKALGDGQLAFLRASVGDEVGQGDTVVYMADYDLEREIDLANLEINRKEAELAAFQQQRTAELRKVEVYDAVNVSNSKQLKFDLKVLQAEVEATKTRFANIEALFKKKFATRLQFEEARSAFKSAEARLSAKLDEMKTQARLREAGLGQGLFNGREFVGGLVEIEASIKLSKHRLALAHQAHEALLRHRERLAIHAPFDGRVLQLPKPEYAAIKKGEVVAVFERHEDRKILAYLTQDEVNKVGRGDTASVYFPSLDTSVKATILQIDRTAGFEEEIGRRYSWRGAEDRSAEVILVIEDRYDEFVEQHVEPGLPAVVLFDAVSTNPVFAAIWRKISSLLL